MKPSPPILHATAIARWGGGTWRAALVRGRSGVGKSDLALRAMAAGWRLVADDRVIAWASGGTLYARAPGRLSGLIEARGHGVRPVTSLPLAAVALVVDLAAEAGDVERLPDPDWSEIEGVRLPRIRLYAGGASAIAKLALALQAATLGARQEAAYQARFANGAQSPDAREGASQEE